MDGTTLLGTLTTMPTILSTVLPTLPPVVLPDLPGASRCDWKCCKLLQEIWHLYLSLNPLSHLSHFSVIHQPPQLRAFPSHLSQHNRVVGWNLQLEGVETSTTSMANTTESVEHLTVVTCSDLGIDSDRMKQSEAGENRKIVTKHRGFVTPIYAVSGNVPNIFAKIQA